MAYYKVCHRCGANLDPGEICDCEKDMAETSGTNVEEAVLCKQNADAAEGIGT